MSNTGQILAKERIRQGKAVSEVVEATHIREDFIKAIEAGRIEKLPGRDYVKYFIKDYAEYLGLDPHPLLGSMQIMTKEDVSSKVPLVILSSFERKRRQKLRRLMFGLISLITVLFLIGIANWKWADRPGPKLSVSSKSPSNVVTKKESPKQPPKESPKESSPVEQELVQPPSEVTIKLWVDKQPSWIWVKADNTVIYQGTLAPGNYKEWNGKEKVELKVGNAGAVRVEVNNENLGVLGKDQEVVKRIFTLDLKKGGNNVN